MKELKQSMSPVLDIEKEMLHRVKRTIADKNKDRDNRMGVEYGIGLVIAVFLFGYLVFFLIHFSSS